MLGLKILERPQHAQEGVQRSMSAAAIGPLLLPRRTRSVAVGTIDAAIACFRLQQCLATLAIIEILASIDRHCLLCGKAALRAGDRHFQRCHCRSLSTHFVLHTSELEHRQSVLRAACRFGPRDLPVSGRRSGAKRENASKRPARHLSMIGAPPACYRVVNVMRTLNPEKPKENRDEL